MKKISMPESAKKIIDTLYKNGYEAYIVGGCVRDSLLGKEPLDFDITTSAEPEDIKRIFERTVDTGIAHGTVTVIEDGLPYEVTTYRIDGEYRDSRHPVSVSFTKNIKEDLARRDFTVNAMAYNERSGMVDAFSGKEDLERGIIRCVRDPEERFLEDALRVLRGIRFSSVLNFEIEEKTDNAMRKIAPNLKNISKERIFSEWKKLLSGIGAYRVISDYKDIVRILFPELGEIRMPKHESFDSLSGKERQLALFALNSSPEEFAEAMNRMKSDSKTRDDGIAILKGISRLKSEEEMDLRLFIIQRDDEISLECAKVAEALEFCEAGIFAKIKEFIDSDAIRRINQLMIGGKELIEIGFKGREVGNMLDDILKLTAIGELPNEREALIDYAKGVLP